MKRVPNAYYANTFELDEGEKLIYELIRRGEPVPTNGNKDISNALTRMRRTGIIENVGGRRHPNWQLSDAWKKYRSQTMILDRGENA